MRAAPIGFFCPTPADAWDMACEIAAITHGHPDGINPAGVLAVTIRLIADGQPLADAIRTAAEFAPRDSATRQALERAFALASAGPPDPDVLNRSLGQGWTGDEALAIAACCALSAATPAAAILAAVNHSGDSDSTGSITGNIIGALHGTAALPDGWLDALDDRELVAQVAADAATELLDPPGGDDDVPEEWWTATPAGSTPQDLGTSWIGQGNRGACRAAVSCLCWIDASRGLAPRGQAQALPEAE